jgi:hypothetical protein
MYIGTTNKSVSCIYGAYNIKENQEVPMLYAVKFPQYVKQVADPIPEVTEEIVVEEPKKFVYESKKDKKQHEK